MGVPQSAAAISLPLFLFCCSLILPQVYGLSNGAIILSQNNISSTSYYYGVVRVYYNGWGNICDDIYFDSAEANVICHQLGYTGASSYSRAGLTSYGTDYYLMKWDDVNCGSSSYLSIAQCSYSTYIDYGCVNSNSYDATVYCYTTRIWNSNPYAGMVRLQDGDYSNEGRVEVYCNGQWGAICSDGFDSTDANTICKQLGYDSFAMFDGSNFNYTNSSQPIWTTGMNSASNDVCFTQSNSCPNSEVMNCTNSSIVSVECSESSTFTRYTADVQSCNLDGTVKGTIILSRNNVASSSYYYGTIRVYHNGWGNICDDYAYSYTEANVICHQLGYTGISSYSRAGLTSYGTDYLPMKWDDVNCVSSSYLSIAQCSYSTIIDSGCVNSNSYDATVYCYTTRIWNSNPYDGMVRLQGGDYSNEGRVEVYCNGQWGTICSDGFDSNNAYAICKQLGYDTSFSFNNFILHENSSESTVWSRSAPNLPTDVCFVTDTCPVSLVSNCKNAVAITCGEVSTLTRRTMTASTCQQYYSQAAAGTIILSRNNVSSASYYYGIVRVYYNGWGNICDDSYYNLAEANVICHQLGYTGASSYSRAGLTSYGTDYLSMKWDDVNCASSSYLSIAQCTYSTYIGYGCYSNSYDATVYCYTTRIWNSNPFPGMVRLQNGDYSNEGRVEVYCNGQWGTICSDGFDSTDANTLCKQLGYDSSSYFHLSYDSNDSLPFWTSNMYSTGYDLCFKEHNNCPNTSVTSCSYSNSISIQCTDNRYSRLGINQDTCAKIPDLLHATNGTIILSRNNTSSASYYYGTVRVYDNGWGNICDDYYFDSAEANVICHQLGYTGASSYSRAGLTNYGTDYLRMKWDDVNCGNSDYLSIFQCSHSTIINSGCVNSNSYDATVYCYTTRIWDSNPFSGMIRLQDGDYSNEGRVEVYCNGQWGTICSDGVDSYDATTLCKQLGFKNYSIFSALPSNSSQPIWSDSMYSTSYDLCYGSSNSCPMNSVTNCSHLNDLFLKCSDTSSFSVVTNTKTSCSQVLDGVPDAVNGAIVLSRNNISSATYYYGTIRVYYNGWGNICDDYYYNSAEANVICHQLGYTGASSYYRAGLVSYGTDYLSMKWDEVNCASSSYLSIVQCSYSTYIDSGCYNSNSYDATVYCYATRIWNSNPYAGMIRLQDGIYSNEGRVEVYCNGQWGTICSDGFDSTDANTLCKQLGYDGYDKFNHTSRFNNTIQPIWNTNMYSTTSHRCFGSGNTCPSRPPVSVTNCSELNDVTLTCRDISSSSRQTVTQSTCSGLILSSVSNGALILSRNNVQWPSYYYGTIRVYYNGWGNICDDYSYGYTEANVICHQLGYTGVSSYSRAGLTSYGTDYLSMKLNDVNCASSSYLSIAQCSYSTYINYGCVNSNSYDATVYCYTTRIWNSNAYDGMVRLQDVAYSNEGRVEVYCNGQWGTICSDGFDSNNAYTICKQLGYDASFSFYNFSLQDNSIDSTVWSHSIPNLPTDVCFVTGTCSVSLVSNCKNAVALNCGEKSTLTRRTVTASTCSQYYSQAASGTIILSRNNVSSASYYYGIVRVYYNGWGNICDDSYYNSAEANVICHQLGYTGASSYSRAGLTSYGTDYLSMKWDDVNCASSSYLSIAQCTYSTYIGYGCYSNSYDATVYCYTTRIWNSNPFPGMVRLQNGDYSNEGRVEVYCNGQWGTICSDGFDSTDANTLCKQLGYDLSSYFHLSYDSNDSLPFWTSNMYSTGYDLCFKEHNNCPNTSVTSCSYSNSISIQCTDNRYSRLGINQDTCAKIPDLLHATNGTIILSRNNTSSAFYYYGTVRVYDNGWGNICDDSYFDSAEANVICHQLGYTGASSYSRAGLTNYGTDYLRMKWDDVNCGNSDYLSIFQCSHSTIIDSGCVNSNSYDATVYCYTTRIWDSNPFSGMIRLQDGDYSNEGRVEVYCNGQWGTICSDGVDSYDATTLCKQLGFKNYTIFSTLPSNSSQPIWSDSMYSTSYDVCYGSSNSCPMNSVTNCSHLNDLFLKCSDTSSFSVVTSTKASCSQVLDGVPDAVNGAIVLSRNNVSSTTYYYGTIRVYYNGWGNICDDYYYSYTEANVICHQLGYTGASSYSRAGSLRYGTDYLSMKWDDVNCASSSYLSIAQCSYSTVIDSGCVNSNSYDATVYCYTTRIWNSNPYAGMIRLQYGTYPNEGRVEVYCNGQWGTICSDGFDSTDANTLCKQLGYDSYEKFNHTSRFNDTIQPIWNTNMYSTASHRCFGSGNSCPSASVTNCSELNDVTLTCRDISSSSRQTVTQSTCSGLILSPVSNGALILSRNNIPSPSYYYGTIRVYYNGWGNLCDDYSYGYTEANVICHQLGYTGVSSYSRAGLTSYGTDYLSMKWDDVNCASSSYLSIAQCSYSTYIDYGCVNSNSNDATVYCYTTRIWNSNPYAGMVRLQGGYYSNEGLVEVYCNGQWGTICSTGFSTSDANTICRQLGYDSGLRRYDSLYGNTSQPIWSTNMYSTSYATCFGSSNSCPSNSITSCSHFSDVSVTCREAYSSTRYSTTSSTCSGLISSSNSASNGALILSRNNVQSPSYYYGTIRVYYNGWGNICDDSYYSYTEANVICHQLGYTGVSSYSRAGRVSYGTDYLSMKLDDVNCASSSYLSIAQCSYSTYIDSGCVNSNSYDATVYCYTTRIWNSNPYAGMVRLQGGYYSNEGLVEVYCNGQWGTICSTGFSTSDANTICRQLGYDSGLRRYDSLYGNTSQPIWSTNMYSTSYATCFGSSNSCPSSSITSCSHSSDVSVTCRETYSTTGYSTTSSTCSGLISGSATAGTIVLYRNGVSSSSYYYGIVQLYYNSRWGNICDDIHYSSSEADVICHQLGYTGAASYSRAGRTSYGTDTNQMIIDDVNCANSNYLTLLQCSFSTYIDSGCTNSNSYDATVYCYTTRIWSSPYTGMLRLQGGNYSNQGRVEVYCNGQWGTICDDGFSSTDARTVCKQLGYSSYYRYDHLSLPGSYNKPIWSTHFSSTSSSTCFNSRNSCPSSSITSCTHSEDVTVACSYSSSSTSVSIVGYCNSNITTTRSNNHGTSVVGGAIGGTFGAITLIIIIAMIFAFFYAYAKKRRSGRMTAVSSTAQRNVATNDRSNIQLNTIPSKTQEWQEPPQYVASPTNALHHPPPPSFPPNAISQRGYNFYVPQNMALHLSTQFYPYPVANLQQTPRDPDEGEKSEANAGSIREAEPPQYDAIYENTEM